MARFSISVELFHQSEICDCKEVHEQGLRSFGTMKVHDDIILTQR